MNLRQHTSLLRSIHNNVADLNGTKIYFKAKLTDGTNPYLPKANYLHNSTIFYWQNDKGSPVYITKYRFIYQNSTEPTNSQLYHSASYTSKIGLVTSDNADFEAPYMEVNNSLDYMNNDGNSNEPKKQWANNTSWCYPHLFDIAPIKVNNGRRFGHLIETNFDDEAYGTDPIGIVEGYYYA